MQKDKAREYRRVVEYIKRLTDTRMALLRAFAETAARLDTHEEQHAADKSRPL
jgi:hypothetical protein